MTTATTATDVLVGTDWLQAHLDDPSIAIVEVDEDTTAFAGGHIPGAIGIDWTTELRDGLRRDFISSEGLAVLLGSKGVSASQTIVLYGGNNNWFAAYAYWLFALRGVERLRLLDGGRKKWQLEARPLSTDARTGRQRNYALGPARPEVRAYREEVLAGVASRSATFVDVRSQQEFSGEVLAPPHLPQEQPYVGGHIPGARNVPWSLAVREDGAFREPEALAELHASNGVSRDGPVITYCRIGERSSHTWFVLHELLGYADVRNYDGSWTEYGSLVDVPVER